MRSWAYASIFEDFVNSSYLSVMFQICDVKVDKAEVAMSLHVELSVEEPEPATEPESLPYAETPDSVSHRPLIVSNQVKGAMAAKVLESLAVQGFSCSGCPKFHYKLYPLSRDCKGALEGARQWKTSAYYQMELFCSTGESTYAFELSITNADRGGTNDA